jgi:hypothetical protein
MTDGDDRTRSGKVYTKIIILSRFFMAEIIWVSSFRNPRERILKIHYQSIVLTYYDKRSSATAALR